MSNEPDEVNNGALATMIVIVAFATLAVALVVTSLVRDETAKLRATKDLTQEREVRELKADQLNEITAAPAWRDREKGLVSVPIDRAMELVLEQVRANPLMLSPGTPPEEEEEDESEEESSDEEGSEDESDEEGEDEDEDESEDESEDSDSEETAKPAQPVEAVAPAKPAPQAPAPTPTPAPAPQAPAKPAPTGVPAQ